MIDWNAIKMTLKKWLRMLLNTYKSEIKKYVAEQVDARLLNLQAALHEEVRQNINNEVIAMAIDMKIDIYTSAGAETIKEMINEYIDRLEKEKGE